MMELHRNIHLVVIIAVVVVTLVARPSNCMGIYKRQSPADETSVSMSSTNSEGVPSDVLLLDNDQVEGIGQEMLAEQRQQRPGQRRVRPPPPPLGQVPVRRIAPPIRRISTFRRRFQRKRNFRRAQVKPPSTNVTTSTQTLTTEVITTVPTTTTLMTKNTMVPLSLMPMANNRAMVANSPPVSDKEEESSISSNKKVTKSTLILGGAISGIAICIFVLVMIGVMYLRRTETSRSTGSIKKIREKERAQKRTKIPRMKSVREMRETIFSSFRKVRKNRRTPRT